MKIEKSLRSLCGLNSKMVIVDCMVYETAICGFFQDHLVTILPAYKDMLPYTLLVEESTFVELKKIAKNGSLSIFFPEQLIIQSIQVEINPFGMLDYLRVLNELKRFLRLFQTEDTSLLIELEKNGEDSAVVSKLIKSLKEGNIDTAVNMLGKGRGLTPALDDFALGLYSFLQAQGDEKKKKMLAAYIQKNIEKTTLVSKWALYYGTKENLFSEPLSSFYQTWKVIDLLPLLRHGSTSGMDLTTGIYYGIKYLL